jgi:uncharacterized cupredoxin-like copper-binding protein
VTTGEQPRSPRRRLLRGGAGFAIAATALLLLGIPLVAPIAHAESAARSLEYGHPVHPAATRVNFTVNATDAPAFLPATLRGAQAGDNVSIRVQNLGSYPHTFTLSKVPNFLLNRNWTPGQLDAWFRANGSFANVSVNPGAVGWANFSVPVNATGASFEFASVVPYQFQAGMQGFLAISAGGPSVVLDLKATSQFQFLPGVLVANATKFPVVLEIKVSVVGQGSHTFTLSAIPGVFVTSSNYTAYFNQHAPLVNLQLPQSGTIYNSTFLVPSAGAYEFICTVPGHFLAGMNGTLWVGVQPPSPPAMLSTALVQTGVLVGAGVLMIFAVMLAVASQYVGRFPRTVAPPGH